MKYKIINSSVNFKDEKYNFAKDPIKTVLKKLFKKYNEEENIKLTLEIEGKLYNIIGNRNLSYKKMPIKKQKGGNPELYNLLDDIRKDLIYSNGLNPKNIFDEDTKLLDNIQKLHDMLGTDEKKKKDLQKF